ncbi:MAG: dienelactone hydrolase family protein [Sphingobium sp.]|uniref:dienelactone hydrolase family protein n=1 Tax=Sphingobium sp. TaxID=1912891 RepID=UPI0029B2EF2F|nr:dienelactone hydrolase family protein [Sphingobium sp.]MDX3911063.1 dienelactone hydrolase family protein [Sphingobium sp.]
MSTENLIYHDGDVELRGELYRPSGSGNGKAILVVHEADGIGGNVRRRCAMLADLGYVAAAADIHGHGRVLAGDEMMAAVGAFRSNPLLFRKRVRSGLDALCKAAAVDAGRVAAIGYCFGGMAVLELARSGAPLAAVASFHGLLTTALPAQRGEVSARVLACTGAKDPLVPIEDITTFQHEMDAAEVDWQLAVYGRALHSFTNSAVADLNDPRMAYDPVADRQSWLALLAFLDDAFPAGVNAGRYLKRHLRP